MKFIKALLTTILILSVCIKSIGQNNVTSTKLLGLISKTDLTIGVYGEWFYPEFDAYLPNTTALSSFKKNVSQYEILVFMGTWCGDSRKEIPRFYKVLESVKYPMAQLKVVAVDNDRSNYKKSPTGEEKGLHIHRVPTFIFYKNGKEVNRIVEHPVETFEADMQKIFTTNEYVPNYNSIEVLQKLLNNKKLDQNQIVEQLKPLVSKDSELNGFGYIHLNAKDYETAITVFKINNLLFPNSFNTYDSLAEAYAEAGKRNLAIENYELAYNLIQKSPVIVELKAKIEKLKNQ